MPAAVTVLKIHPAVKKCRHLLGVDPKHDPLIGRFHPGRKQGTVAHPGWDPKDVAALEPIALRGDDVLDAVAAGAVDQLIKAVAVGPHNPCLQADIPVTLGIGGVHLQLLVDGFKLDPQTVAFFLQLHHIRHAARGVLDLPHQLRELHGVPSFSFVFYII